MKSYSFANVIGVINGVSLSGYGEGDDVITAQRREDSASDVMGVDGEMTVSLSTNRSGILVIKLMQNSVSNAFLTALIAAQENSAFVPVAAQVINTEGGEVISGTNGYMLNPAGLSFGKNPLESEWTFVLERLDIVNLGSLV